MTLKDIKNDYEREYVRLGLNVRLCEIAIALGVIGLIILLSL